MREIKQVLYADDDTELNSINERISSALEMNLEECDRMKLKINVDKSKVAGGQEGSVNEYRSERERRRTGRGTE